MFGLVFRNSVTTTPVPCKIFGSHLHSKGNQAGRQTVNMPYTQPEVRYCNRARIVLVVGCIVMLFLFYGLIEALAPKPKLRIKLDKDAELVALRLDRDGDGKISTSDIIAALAGDEKELEQLEQELVDQSLEFSIKLRGKDVDVKAAQKKAGDLKKGTYCQNSLIVAGNWVWKVLPSHCLVCSIHTLIRLHFQFRS